jgi:hypothetical protein
MERKKNEKHWLQLLPQPLLCLYSTHTHTHTHTCTNRVVASTASTATRRERFFFFLTDPAEATLPPDGMRFISLPPDGMRFKLEAWTPDGMRCIAAPDGTRCTSWSNVCLCMEAAATAASA